MHTGLAETVLVGVMTTLTACNDADVRKRASPGAARAVQDAVRAARLGALPPTPTAFARSFPRADPRDGWPSEITFDRLELPRETLQRQQWALGRKLPHGLRSGTVLRHTYAVTGPTGHGLMTEVTYLVDPDVFYLRSDCMQGHADGTLGPFAGDPRRVLAVAPVTTP